MINTILIVGIISSLLFYEITEISPGGIIAPVYLAMYIDAPQKIAITLILAIFTYIVVEFLSTFMILYGRRKFVVYIAVSLILKVIFEKIGFVMLESLEIFISTSAIGIIIPAIIARDIEKQGILKTICSILMVSIFTKVVTELIYNLGAIL
ncbi:poly-gamma-glutamate biosynthesis protein PgsC [Fusobacterium sp.]|uniref:poly-gamma-glutamate biosynthesis protein PgsC n=1 Tax=Fusobacterium sp. TaxID=68766 RepID=UPI0025C0FF32|nr:poly-gamma-glutamate biosynthesis protein PgsC [Fusobacterium sp.]MCI5725178.1 poly-gamma-glutamate biosynthesis protein PgsC [Fusobacterium sp.]